MKKRITLIIFLLAAAGSLLAVGCGSNNKSSKNQTSVVTFEKDILAADSSLPDMTTVDSDSEEADSLFAYLSDVDYSKIHSYFLSYSSDGLADEVAVIRVKDTSDVDEVKESVEDHIRGRVNFYKSYDVTQVDRAEDALIFTNGNDVVLIVSDNPKDIKSAYKDKVE